MIDGIPMPRLESTQIASAFGGMDRGDGIENLNSEDIESITVLPGSASAALYGSQGANGVILITTKKGTAGKTVINFSSNTTFETPFQLPKFQNSYGPSTPGAGDSWATTPLTSPSTFNPKDFYQYRQNLYKLTCRYKQARKKIRLIFHFRAQTQLA